MNPLEKELKEHIERQAKFREQADAEMKSLGSVTKETATKLTELQSQVDAIDKKMAEKAVASTDGEPAIEVLKSSPELQELMRRKKGHANIDFTPAQAASLLERKTVTTSGNATLTATGVLQIDRLPGITTEARQVLKIRDLLDAATTTMQVVDFVKVNAALSNASPQVEAAAKYSNNVTFTSVSERIKTIATYIRASRQILDDMTELDNFLRTGLAYYVNNDEDIELLSGSAVGEHLNGLITQATAFNTALLPAAGSYKRSDMIGRVCQQIEIAKELPATFCVLHPTDYWNIRLEKDTQGRYIYGDPGNNQGLPKIWGLDFVRTTNVASGTFLVGSGDPAASQIRDRMGLTIDISTEDADNFTTNLVTIRVEKRLALVVRRPGSYITGTFTQSPA